MHMSDEDNAQMPPEIVFHFEKSPQHRVVHVDGAFGGPTPQGLFHLALYSERNPIPQSVTQELTKDGALGQETDRRQRDGVFREIEVSAIMTFQTLKSINEWTKMHLERIEAAQGSSGESS